MKKINKIVVLVLASVIWFILVWVILSLLGIDHLPRQLGW